MRAIKTVFCVLLLVLVCACAFGEDAVIGAQWTGLEWNGSTKGEYPNHNCDIVAIGRVPIP